MKLNDMSMACWFLFFFVFLNAKLHIFMAIALNYNCQLPLSGDMKWPSFTEYEQLVEQNVLKMSQFFAHICYVHGQIVYCRIITAPANLWVNVGPIFRLKTKWIMCCWRWINCQRARRRRKEINGKCKQNATKEIATVSSSSFFSDPIKKTSINHRPSRNIYIFK